MKGNAVTMLLYKEFKQKWEKEKKKKKKRLM